MYSCRAAEPGSYWLQAAFLRQRSELAPKKIIRCRRPCSVKWILSNTGQCEEAHGITLSALAIWALDIIVDGCGTGKRAVCERVD